MPTASLAVPARLRVHVPVACVAAAVGDAIATVGGSPSVSVTVSTALAGVAGGIARRDGDDVDADLQRHARDRPGGRAGGDAAAAAVVGPAHLRDAEVIARRAGEIQRARGHGVRRIRRRRAMATAGVSLSVRVTVTVSVAVRPAASRAVTVMTLAPAESATDGTLQRSCPWQRRTHPGRSSTALPSRQSVRCHAAEEHRGIRRRVGRRIGRRRDGDRGFSWSVSVTVRMSVAVLPLVSRAVTVMTFEPGCSVMPETDHAVVPVAVPAPPRLLAHVTCAMPNSSGRTRQGQGGGRGRMHRRWSAT